MVVTVVSFRSFLLFRYAVSGFSICPNQKRVDNRENLFLESLDIFKQTSDIPEKFERTFPWKICENFGLSAFNLFEIVVGCGAFSHSIF